MCDKHSGLTTVKQEATRWPGLAIQSIHDADVLVYHSPCTDGSLAAALAYSFNPKLKMIGADPQAVQEGRLDGDLKDKRVIFCDVCPRSVSERQLVLDHHPAASDVASRVGKHVVWFDSSCSGAAIMWTFLTGKKVSEAPEFVRAVDLHDRGRFEESNAIRGELYYTAIGASTCFECYLELCWNPEPRLRDPEVHEEVNRKKRELEFYKSLAKEVTFFERKATLIYGPDKWFATGLGRMVLKDPKSDLHTLFILARYDPTTNKTYWSFRSHDGCSARAAAQVLGGNGHGDAAGAETAGSDIAQYFCSR